MYSGEATVTNDQLEGVLKAGDILRVRGLWRSNNGSKKENIQSNNQKVERDKKEAAPLPGQIQKIKLVQPMPEKIVENVQQPVATQGNLPAQKSLDSKVVENNDEKTKDPESAQVHEENKTDDESKSKGNTEANSKKRKIVNADTESSRTRSEAGDNVCDIHT